jgi:hypothetical protein
MSQRVFVKPILTCPIEPEVKKDTVDIQSFFDEEAEQSDDSSNSDATDDESDKNEYDFDDGFLVPDDEIEECDESEMRNQTLQDELEFEKARTKQTLSEISELQKRLAIYQRKLKEVTKKKKIWKHRASISLDTLKRHGLV